MGELFALRWDNVDMLRRQVSVTETLTDLAGQMSFGPPKTRASLLTVSLPSFVTEELSLTTADWVRTERRRHQRPNCRSRVTRIAASLDTAVTR